MEVNNIPKHKSTAYAYLYECRGWLGSHAGARNMIFDDSDDLEKVKKAALADAQRASGSSQCHVALLQKFYITVQLGTPYRALMQFPSVQFEETNNR